jgi:hypothetical protein
MTCQECEIKLGMGEDGSEHLASCAECRGLARELRLNSCAMRDMRVRPVMPWVLAAAAIAMVIAVWRIPAVKPPEKAAAAKIGRPTKQELPVLSSVAPTKRRSARRRKPAEQLRVKMFTSDPDVVIYWIVDKREGYE